MTTLQKRRETCVENLQRARVDVADPGRALWPAVADRLRDDDQLAAEALHVSLYQYIKSVERESAKDGGRWIEEVVPEHVFPDGATLAVTLQSIEKWNDIRYEDTDGTVQNVHLPVAYARELLRQVDRFAADRGLVDVDDDITGVGATDDLNGL